jgi:hypothetical protein
MIRKALSMAFSQPAFAIETAVWDGIGDLLCADRLRARGLAMLDAMLRT